MKKVGVVRKNWTPISWKKFQRYQMPTYKSQYTLKTVQHKLEKYPPIVFANEIDNLKTQLKKCAQNEAFIIQGGDCAESFDNYNFESTLNLIKVLVHMSLIYGHETGKSVIKIGRMAGQYAKPRSQLYEAPGILSFKGDIIHSQNDRTPDPERMFTAYFHSVSTLNVLRNINVSGYMNLINLDHWTHNLLQVDPAYQILVTKIKEHLRFLKSCNIDTSAMQELYSPTVFVSHECLLLDYEMPFVRKDTYSNNYYDCSAHFLWLGDRTRALDSAHVEFLRGVQNPIGIKCGPSTDNKELVEIIKTINPNNEIGKIVLITRYGHDNVSHYLNNLLLVLALSDVNVLYMCDPMHGNTFKTENGTKTRDLKHIISEIMQTKAILQDHKLWLSGIHLEMTGDNVTECVGGVENIDLSQNYQSLCDPRLNATQSMELIFQII